MNDFGLLSINKQNYSFEIVPDFSASSDGLSYINEDRVIKIDNLFVAPYDPETNNLPVVIRELVKQNQLLPELIEKQIRFLYGKGAYLYKEVRDAEAKNRRVPINDQEIYTWLNSWKKNGLKDSYENYLIKAIREFYYVEGVYSKYLLSRGRNVMGALPIVGLEVESSIKARKASKNPKYVYNYDFLDDKDFNYIVIGQWPDVYNNTYDVYPRFNERAPFAKNSINYSANSSFGEEIYAYPVFYHSLKYWLSGSNVNPKQLNSFFKNLLTAQFHVKIPSEWIEAEKVKLESLINSNIDLEIDGLYTNMIKEYKGVELVDSDNKVLMFNEIMLSMRVRYELERLTDTMTGEDNAGKTFSTVSYGESSWQIEEIPVKIKDFITALIDHNKHAVEVILSGKGLDPAISNVSKEGVISKSGSDAYYQYLIYINNLTIPESVICYDINKAIELNFPNKDIKLGFLHHIPERMEEVSPDNRLNSQNQ